MRIVIEIFFILSVSGLILKAMSEPTDKRSDYEKGYHDAKQIYESQDFDYTEEKLLND